MMRTLKILLLCLSGMAAECAAAPMNLYLTAGDQHEFYLVQGAVVTTIPGVQNGAEYAIAVNGTVRLLSAYAFGGYNQSREYTLAGAPTGTTYTNALTQELLDGTTDGTYNYALAWDSGAVYRFDANWANPSLLFDVAGTPDFIGITYDTQNNSLWLQNRDANTISNFDLTGNLLSTFSLGAGWRTALAMDYSDGTLWTLNHGDVWELEQYSRTGSLLGTFLYNGPHTNILGAEFPFVPAAAPVPEPASLALWSLIGAAALAVWRGRKRRPA